MRTLANLLGLFMAVFGVFIVIGSYAMPHIDVEGVGMIVVFGLVLTGAGAMISWTDVPGPYSVYRGTRSGGSTWAYNQTCHDAHIIASSATDSEHPSMGTMFFYLVTRVGACGESIPGQDSGGHPNPNPSPCP